MEIVHDRIHDALTNTLPLIVWMNRDIDNFKVAAAIPNYAAHRDQLPLITHNGGKQTAWQAGLRRGLASGRQPTTGPQRAVFCCARQGIVLGVSGHRDCRNCTARSGKSVNTPSTSA